VSADKLYQYPSESIRNVHDEPILVSSDVEDDAVVGDKIKCSRLGSKSDLSLAWVLTLSAYLPSVPLPSSVESA
jgi:hypothetical protein